MISVSLAPVTAGGTLCIVPGYDQGQWLRHSAPGEGQAELDPAGVRPLRSGGGPVRENPGTGVLQQRAPPPTAGGRGNAGIGRRKLVFKKCICLYACLFVNNHILNISR